MWHGVTWSSTAGCTPSAWISCMHRITEDFALQLTGNEPAGKDQMEKQVRWSDSRNPPLKHEGRKTNSQYWNLAVLHLSRCSKAFGLLIPLLLWLRAIKDLKTYVEATITQWVFNLQKSKSLQLKEIWKSCIRSHLYGFMYIYLYLNKRWPERPVYLCMMCFHICHVSPP